MDKAKIKEYVFPATLGAAVLYMVYSAWKNAPYKMNALDPQAAVDAGHGTLTYVPTGSFITEDIAFWKNVFSSNKASGNINPSTSQTVQKALTEYFQDFPTDPVVYPVPWNDYLLLKVIPVEMAQSMVNIVESAETALEDDSETSYAKTPITNNNNIAAAATATSDVVSYTGTDARIAPGSMVLSRDAAYTFTQAIQAVAISIDASQGFPSDSQFSAATFDQGVASIVNGVGSVLKNVANTTKLFTTGGISVFSWLMSNWQIIGISGVGYMIYRKLK
jgi:hypothetical protein